MRPDTGNQLWPSVDKDDEVKCFTHQWGANKVVFTSGVLSITTEVDLSEEEQVALVKCLTQDDPAFVPHWQTLTPDLHRTVQRIEKQVMEAARVVDYSFRKSPKGIRLTPFKVPKQFINQSQAFPVVRWRLSDDERMRLQTLYSHLKPSAQQAYDQQGILIPLPVSFERRQVHLNKNEVDEIFTQISNTVEIPPFWALYGVAWESFENKSFDSAVLILATAIETALKWLLNQRADCIASYLIENTQSPPVEKLYQCARENTPVDFPEHFKKWLVRMRDARNFVAHKPRRSVIDPLEIARWFAVGEAIFKATSGQANDPLVGYIVEPQGEKADSKFPRDTRGVVLRREELYNQNSLHVVLDTGETWRFNEGAYKRAANQSFPEFER